MPEIRQGKFFLQKVLCYSYDPKMHHGSVKVSSVCSALTFESVDIKVYFSYEYLCRVCISGRDATKFEFEFDNFERFQQIRNSTTVPSALLLNVVECEFVDKSLFYN